MYNKVHPAVDSIGVNSYFNKSTLKPPRRKKRFCSLAKFSKSRLR